METDKSGRRKIAIIGAGTLGKALVTGLLRRRFINAKDLVLSNPSLESLTPFRKQGVNLTKNNREAALLDVVILTVRPEACPYVLDEIKGSLSKNTLIISAVACLSLQAIQKAIGKHAVVRIMPNLAVAVDKSVTCWIKSKEVSDDQTRFVKKLLRMIGTELECFDERIFAKVTAISGSGPAYFWYVAHLLEKAAVDIGVETSLAKKLVAQTFFGSAVLAAETKKSYTELVDEVATKGGITQEALDVFIDEKVDKTFKKAIKKAYQKSKLLGER